MLTTKQLKLQNAGGGSGGGIIFPRSSLLEECYANLREITIVLNINKKNVNSKLKFNSQAKKTTIVCWK